MQASFDYFVIFAEMRTGSNFLESNLSNAGAFTSFGEAFNPHFIGYPNQADVLGVTQAQRDSEPMQLLDAVREYDGFGGFRYFHDHDPRVLDAILNDPRCAKIILTRNPLDSYISLKIAKETGQWKLTNVKKRKDAQVAFDTAEFDAHLADLQQFQLVLMQGLQKRGQTPFYIAYEDLQNVDVLNGLLQWLGFDERLPGLDDKLKRQNPEPAISKVSNPTEMAENLTKIDTFDLSRTPNFEPRRGPNVRSYVTAPQTALLFMPIKGGPEDEICRWLADLDSSTVDALQIMDGQKQLREWMSANPGHRSFTVLRHPLARAHKAFCDVALTGKSQFSQKLRSLLKGHFQVELPKGKAIDHAQHRVAFQGFLEFLKQNLNGQSVLRVDARWVSQSTILSGFEEFCAPDLVLREHELEADLLFLGQKFGRSEARTFQLAPDPGDLQLADIYDAELEAQAQVIYRRDYMLFGFEPWRPTSKS
ncbi:nodulation protein NodH [Epibacterium ulvae]|uniref:nodulation protein NodH n=1 Tax=Epibacterium ulvae TaxID=1156985 RepID=UPI001BFC6C17|nr:nodulation protein NodH [Epibacterium ulvae]MBT8153536.1 nodulation protein NodH [Epibacterium ulvae]